MDPSDAAPVKAPSATASPVVPCLPLKLSTHRSTRDAGTATCDERGLDTWATVAKIRSAPAGSRRTMLITVGTAALVAAVIGGVAAVGSNLKTVDDSTDDGSTAPAGSLSIVGRQRLRPGRAATRAQVPQPRDRARRRLGEDHRHRPERAVVHDVHDLAGAPAGWRGTSWCSGAIRAWATRSSTWARRRTSTPSSSRSTEAPTAAPAAGRTDQVQRRRSRRRTRPSTRPLPGRSG